MQLRITGDSDSYKEMSSFTTRLYDFPSESREHLNPKSSQWLGSYYEYFNPWHHTSCTLNRSIGFKVSDNSWKAKDEISSLAET